jgi:raffinose/stachyose/melibiose transport system substrate-binding protein
MVSVRGKTYGFLQRGTLVTVNYNRGLFRSMGLKVPTTFSELLKVCGTIREKAPNLTPMTLNGTIPDALGFNLIGFASSEVYGIDARWNAKREHNKVTFASSKGWRTALNRFVQMKNARCFAPDVAATTPQGAWAQMASGQAVMLFANEQSVGQIKALNAQADIGQFVPPGTTQKRTQLTVVPFQALSVNAKAKNPVAARAFVDYMASRPASVQFTKLLGEQPPYDYQRALNRKIGAKALDADHKFAAPFATAGKIQVAGNALWPTTNVFVAIQQGVQGMLTGQSTPAGILRNADAAWPKR